MKHCKCGRLLSAGWTCGASGHSVCLICWTARVMRRFNYPAAYETQRQWRKKRGIAQ